MIFGIGHYNDKKQAEFVQHMVAAFQRHHATLLRSNTRQLTELPNWFPDDVIIPGIQTAGECAHVKQRRGLLLKIIHPGVAPTTPYDKHLMNYEWDYVLGVNGDSESLIEDAQEFADWLCGHACRPTQSAQARHRAHQTEQEAINDANIS